MSNCCKVLAYIFNPRTREAESGRAWSSRPVWSTEPMPGKPRLHRGKTDKNHVHIVRCQCLQSLIGTGSEQATLATGVAFVCLFGPRDKKKTKWFQLQGLGFWVLFYCFLKKFFLNLYQTQNFSLFKYLTTKFLNSTLVWFGLNLTALWFLFLIAASKLKDWGASSHSMVDVRQCQIISAMWGVLVILGALQALFGGTSIASCGQ